MAARIPHDIELEVVRQLYADADAMVWDGLTSQQHTAQYDKWVADPKIGGRLTEFLELPAAARHWIKDGPMKERRRAASGVGKYAELIEGSSQSQQKVVRKALGEEWEPDLETQRVKPLRVVARKGEGEAVVTWAPSNGFKHMVWAALTASANGDDREWVICVTETFSSPTPANIKQAQSRLAARCGLRLAHVVV